MTYTDQLALLDAIENFSVYLCNEQCSENIGQKGSSL